MVVVRLRGFGRKCALVALGVGLVPTGPASMAEAGTVRATLDVSVRVLAPGPEGEGAALASARPSAPSPARRPADDVSPPPARPSQPTGSR